MTEPANPILATMKQDAYAEGRRRYREEVFLPYLAERDLPGSPAPIVPKEAPPSDAPKQPWQMWRHPPGCPDGDFCFGNKVCYWRCDGNEDDPDDPCHIG